ncbi:MAG: hypothetical protein RBU45_04445 [Myxococcota bacterium]|nr:hypothetical protein [Myxococcota bacterium]
MTRPCLLGMLLVLATPARGEGSGLGLELQVRPVSTPEAHLANQQAAPFLRTAARDAQEAPTAPPAAPPPAADPAAPEAPAASAAPAAEIAPPAPAATLPGGQGSSSPTSDQEPEPRPPAPGGDRPPPLEPSAPAPPDQEPATGEAPPRPDEAARPGMAPEELVRDPLPRMGELGGMDAQRWWGEAASAPGSQGLEAPATRRRDPERGFGWSASDARGLGERGPKTSNVPPGQLKPRDANPGQGQGRGRVSPPGLEKAPPLQPPASAGATPAMHP